MAQEKTKYSFRDLLLAPKTIVESADIWENNVLKIVVEFAGATNEVAVYGKIANQASFVFVDSLIGSGTKTFDIELYDSIKVVCQTFDSTTNHITVTGSAFTTPSTIGDVTATISGMVEAATNPAIYNISMLSNATEYSFSLPGNTKRLCLKDREYTSTIKFSFVSGGTTTAYQTLPRGCNYEEAELGLTVAKNIYLKSDKNNVTVELLVWT